ncbi:LysM domain-containing protein [Hyaloscypha finlandica]|nr:LysM domain-containing protein [Hyaloscypha finlandica]
MQLLLSIVTLFGAANIGAAVAVVRRDCSFTFAAENGDTCLSMATSWGITQAEFISYNPGAVCSALVSGKEYCVEWTGAAPVTTSSTTTKSTTSSVISSTTTSAAPSGPSPTQDGIVSDCKKFHLAASGDTCGGIVSKYGVFTLAQFYAWNPALGNDCSGLWLGYYYCVAVTGTPTTTAPATTTTAAPSGPSPTQDGIVADCKRYHIAASGDTCQKIVDTYQTFSLTQFDCSGLWLGYNYCIAITGTPTTAPDGPTVSPTQSGVSAKCNKWYLVASGDYCQKIADQFAISLSDFYTLNPAVGTSCGSLWLGYYVCVGSS